MIPKPNKDQRKVASMCPISILCNDYKLVEKILANRIKPALEYIINKDQKGFLSSRRISCNIRRVIEMIDYVEELDEPGLIVSVDFMKCFDRIEIPALLGALNYFNFGDSYIRWTKMIYTDPVACVSNNGYFSDYFPVTRSVKQGGPNSAYYFLILAEVLAIEMRKNPKIKGFWIQDILHILGQYADDMDMYLWGDQGQCQQLLILSHTLRKNLDF